MREGGEVWAARVLLEGWVLALNTDKSMKQSLAVTFHPPRGVPAMMVCLKSSSFRWGRKQTILSQVISHRSENPVLESALWKIPAVSMTSSMFFRDSGMASSCTRTHRHRVRLLEYGWSLWLPTGWHRAGTNPMPGTDRKHYWFDVDDFLLCP